MMASELDRVSSPSLGERLGRLPLSRMRVEQLLGSHRPSRQHDVACDEAFVACLRNHVPERCGRDVVAAVGPWAGCPSQSRAARTLAPPRSARYR